MYKHFQRKLSLTFIAVALCCALVLVPVICSILYFNTSVARRLEDTARETASFYLDSMANQTSETLETLRNSIYYLMSDSKAQEIMHSQGSATPSQQLAVEEGLNRALFLGSQLSQRAVTGIYLIQDKTRYISVLRNGMSLGTANRVMHVFENMGSHNSARDLCMDPSFPGYCYMIVDYFDLDTMKPLGKIIIELNTSGLVDTTYLETLYQQSSVILRTTSGTILNGQDKTLVKAADKSDSHYLEVNKEAYYYASRQLTPCHAQIDVFIPHREIFETSSQATQVYIFFALMILGITLILGALAAYFLYKPIRQMFGKINRLSAGELSVRMESTPYRETEKMSAAFNNMADHLEALFEEVYEQGILLRDAEFKLLESQIRPHFIFNVLELINIRCMEAGQNALCHTVTNLAQLLRSNIANKHEQVITIQEELNYVRYYLELQKERFQDSLNYSISLEDPDLLQYSLPKLTIQPLVENSIVHGLEPKRGGGSVRIGIWEEEDSVCIRISDDGMGFDASSVNLNTDKSSDTTHNHIALENIARRIQLLYGKSYGMRILSSPGQGTTITVTLPVVLTKEMQKGE